MRNYLLIFSAFQCLKTPRLDCDTAVTKSVNSNLGQLCNGFPAPSLMENYVA